MNKRKLLEKITAAKTELMEAEADLDRCMREIRIAPRAEKTTITAMVEAAFSKLRSARADLVELEALANEDD